MGSESEALGWRNGFRAFHGAKMSSQDTQVNTVGCIFLPKTKLNTLRPYTWAELHAHAYFFLQVGTALIVLIRSLRTKAHDIAISYLFPVVT